MRILLALTPVLLFLGQLWAIDSFKLVHPRAVLGAIATGGAAALAGALLDSWLLTETGLAASTFDRYVAPVIEETTKASCLAVFLVRRQVGFLVDAAVLGFAVGTGFALVENVQYLWALQSGSVLHWLVRGFGTAMLHGAATSVFAMISKTVADRHAGSAWAFLPGWAAAVGMHTLFNQSFVPAIAETLLMLLVLPLVMLWVFGRSERATREWVGAGLDLDLELLQLVASEHFTSTRFGCYLGELKQRLPGLVVADMFCLLRLEIEMSIQAKALLMAREAGFEIPAGYDREALLAELEYLQRSIGTAGLLALKPLEVTDHRDRWHRVLLHDARR